MSGKTENVLSFLQIVPDCLVLSETPISRDGSSYFIQRLSMAVRLRRTRHLYKTLADLRLTLEGILRIATLPALVRGKPRHQPATLTARTNAVGTIAGV